ncbi:hypothetical protein PCANC_25091 [Puccinia coronata f. sp. avenae]|uniref:Uncharacterized protein n=1 Tax=Puccinia coronata f. sp. avenae TaxID=200324 RepID=A0A2N5TAP3_9BASI|nr:hypothetical protein PCANC_25091 [Puccinia coronata f. sp. avenae]
MNKSDRTVLGKHGSICWLYDPFLSSVKTVDGKAVGASLRIIRWLFQFMYEIYVTHFMLGNYWVSGIWNVAKCVEGEDGWLCVVGGVPFEQERSTSHSTLPGCSP